MFTRLKLFSPLLFFLLFFLTLVVFWGENGVFARNEMENRAERLEEMVKEMESSNALLKERSEAEKGKDSEKRELLISFGDEELSFQKEEMEEGKGQSFSGLSTWKCLRISLLATVVYSLLSIALTRLFGGRRKNG